MFPFFGGLFFLRILLLILFWVGLILFALWLVRTLFKSGRKPGAGQPLSALDILDQRYARGEISREQYELMRKDILAEPPPASK